MATISNKQAGPKPQPVILPDTGDQNIKIGYSATIITGMAGCAGILLQELMDYLAKYHERAFDEMRDHFDAMDSCNAVMRDHAETIQKITG